jgi:prefoldin subunit 5
MSEKAPPPPKKGPLRNANLPVYVLLVILVLDVVLAFLPVSIPGVGAWSLNYATGVAGLVVMAVVVVISREITGGFEDTRRRLEEQKAALDAKVEAMGQRVDQLVPESASRVAALAVTLDKVAEGVEGVKKTLAEVQSQAFGTARTTAESGGKIVALQGSFDELGKKVSALEGTQSKLGEYLERVERTMESVEQELADLGRAVKLAGAAGTESERQAGEVKGMISTVTTSLREVHSRLAELDRKSGGVKELAEQFGRSQAALTRVEKDLSALEKGFSTVEKGVSTLERDLSKVGAKLDKVAKIEGRVSQVERRLAKVGPGGPARRAGAAQPSKRSGNPGGKKATPGRDEDDSPGGWGSGSPNAPIAGSADEDEPQ